MTNVHTQMLKNIEEGLKHLKELLVEVRELSKDLEWWDKIRKSEEGQINPNVKRIGGTAYIEDKLLAAKIKDLNKFLWDNLSSGVNNEEKKLWE